MQPGQRISWQAGSTLCSGTITRVIEQGAILNAPGDLVVRPDGRPYTVIVPPEFAIKG